MAASSDGTALQTTKNSRHTDMVHSVVLKWRDFSPSGSTTETGDERWAEATAIGCRQLETAFLWCELTYLEPWEALERENIDFSEARADQKWLRQDHCHSRCLINSPIFSLTSPISLFVYNKIISWKVPRLSSHIHCFPKHRQRTLLVSKLLDFMAYWSKLLLLAFPLHRAFPKRLVFPLSSFNSHFLPFAAFNWLLPCFQIKWKWIIIHQSNIHCINNDFTVVIIDIVTFWSGRASLQQNTIAIHWWGYLHFCGWMFW